MSAHVTFVRRSGTRFKPVPGPTCCYISKPGLWWWDNGVCPDLAAFEILSEGAPQDMTTFACTAHAGLMLEPGTSMVTSLPPLVPLEEVTP